MADGPAAPQETSAHILPHNIEAEQALLGALMVNNDVYDRVAAILRAEHFFDPVHARIFEVAAERIKKNALATPVTLKAFFENDAGLQELGGPAYLARLAARRDLAVRGARLCAADLRSRDPPRADPSRPRHRRKGDAHGGRQRAARPDRRGRAATLPARRTGQGRQGLPELPPRRHRRGQRRERRLSARRRPRRHLLRPSRSRQVAGRPAHLGSR